MTKKIIKAAAIIVTLSFAATAIYYYLPQTWRYIPASTISGPVILDYDEARDTAEILDIFKKDWYWLISSEDYSPEFMLKNRAPKMHDPRYYGKLIIKVMYDNNQFVGFTTYYMKNFFIGQILFVAVKQELRGKGYAQKLTKYAIEDLKKHGATMITLLTRSANTAAQAVYKKLGFNVTFEEDGFVYFDMRV